MNVRVNVGPKSQEAEASLLAQRRRGKFEKIKNVGNKFPKQKAKEYGKKAMEYGKKYGRKAMEYGKRYGPQAMEYIKKYGINHQILCEPKNSELKTVLKFKSSKIHYQYFAYLC